MGLARCCASLQLPNDEGATGMLNQRTPSPRDCLAAVAAIYFSSYHCLLYAPLFFLFPFPICLPQIEAEKLRERIAERTAKLTLAE